ncbi:MAG: DUF4405 domain-containing protein [Peptococcaceae bacterium]|jgi:hypothetical protein|nr:DUF4405 domain-containing protein [Peptococcaceae bacterium]
MKRLPIKGVLSCLLFLIFCFLVFSGALLYIGKTGVIMGIARGTLRDVHFWVALLACVLIPVHVFLNRSLFLSEMKSLVSRDI